ncbi:MAG TPA: RES family NAD+ phosphorylase [Gemmatimonadaceae bacterium]
MTSPWHPPALATLGDAAAHIALTPGGASAPFQEARVRWTPASRAIVSEYAGENLFDRLGGEADLEAFQRIADLTNPAARALAGEIHLVPPEDRIYGPGTPLIMAAFAWPARHARFSTAHEGAFYAARSDDTAIAERRWHSERVLRAAGSGPTAQEVTLLHANLDGVLLDIRRPNPSPPGVYDPADYTAGQQLGIVVRRLKGDGIVYDSVRDPGGECAAIFRPPVLSGCMPARTITLEWDGSHLTVGR